MRLSDLDGAHEDEDEDVGRVRKSIASAIPQVIALLGVDDDNIRKECKGCLCSLLGVGKISNSLT